MNRTLLVAAAAALSLSLSSCKLEVVCAPGQTLCGDRCTATDVDASNCGGCGVRCGSHAQCSASACTAAPGATACGAAYVDLQTDPANCGACGAACTTAQACRADGVLGTGCLDGACPTGTSPCGSDPAACVKLQEDRFNCGACGNECRRGESCRAGACTPDLYVACFATNDVRPVDAELRSGIPQPAGQGPVSIAIGGGKVYVSSSLSHSVTAFQPSLRSAGYEHLLGGGDLENVTAHGGRIYVSNADAGTLVVMRADTGDFVDEVVLSPHAGANPRAIAFVRDTAFVALGGRDPDTGGEVAVVDFSGPRGVITDRISLRHLASEGAIPSPSGVVAVGDKVYVTVGNLKLGYVGYSDPAGPSKLAIIDASVDPLALSSIDLGDQCQNAGAMAADGTSLWIGCSWTLPLATPPWFDPYAYLLPIDLASGSPVAGTGRWTVGAGVNGPWSIAFCRGMGYVSDSWSGNVLRFDPSSAATIGPAVSVCPNGPQGWTFGSSVACAP